jgi:signal transduction histidine kinase/ligand-binding sensor domain-containing protein
MKIKNRLIKYLIAAWVLFYAIPCSSSVAFYHYGIENGLPEARIISISQDSIGFIWLAGENSLYRFDGQQFKAYQNTGNDFSVIPASKINTIFTASDGTLWLGSENGISHYNFYQDKFIGPIEGWENVHVFDFAEDSEKNLWIATDEGLARFNPNNSKTTWYTGPENIKIPKNAILPISNIDLTACQPDGKIWFSGTYGGLFRLNPQTLEIENFNNFGGTDFGSFEIEDLQFSDNQVFAGTMTNGFFWFNPEEKEVNHQHFDHQGYAIKNFRIVDDSIVWLASNSGLFRFNIQTNQYNIFDSNQNDPLSLERQVADFIYTDNNNNLWVSSGIRGVNFGLSNIPFNHFESSSGGPYQLTYQEVTSMQFDHDGNMWFGYEAGFIEKHSHTPLQLEQFQLTSKNMSGAPGSVMSIFEDSRQRIWIGTWQGCLQIFNPVRSAFEHINFKPDSLNHQLETSDVRGITEDNDGNIWVSFHGIGIGKYNPESGYLKLFRNDPENPNTSLSNDYAYNFCTDNDNNLWVATAHGVSKLNLETEQFSTFFKEDGNPQSLSDNNISTVHCDISGTVWAGTVNGLNFFNPELNSFQPLLTGDDYPFQNITAIESVSPGEIWCSTHSGIFHVIYNWDSGNDSISFQTRFLDHSDGLVSTNYFPRSSATEGHNNIYFGGNAGVDFFNPTEVKKLKRPVIKTLITEISVDGQSYFAHIDTTSSEIPLLELEHNKRMVSFRFATPYFQYNTQWVYRYMLEGFNSEWIYPQNEQVATYTNLTPGKYSFRVEVQDKNGKWQSEPVLLCLKIKTPFWKTPLFIILMVVFIVSLFVFILKWRSRTHIKRQKELEKIIQESTLELTQKNKELEVANQTKDKFFSIISHDLRSPFSGLLGILDLVTDPENEFDAPTQKELLQSAKQSAHNTFELLENLLLWARSQMRTTTISVKKHNLSEVLKKNIELKKQIADQKEISLSGRFPENLKASFDREMINTVIRNILSNAIKFTPPGGNVNLYTTSNNGEITISIAYTGIGTDIKETDKLFEVDKTHRTGTNGEKGTGLGLIICKEFVKNNNGEIWVEPNKPQGTIFHFTLPAAKN